MSKPRSFPSTELRQLPLDADIIHAAGRDFANVDGEWYAQTQAGTWRQANWMVRGLANQLLDFIASNQ